MRYDGVRFRYSHRHSNSVKRPSNDVISHAGTVVPECFKDDNASQWKSGKFDPRSLKNPNRSSPKFAWVTTSWTPTPMQNFIKIRLPPFAPPNTRKFASSDSASFFGSSVSLQLIPLHRFSRSIRQMTSFRARMCLLGVPKTKFYILTPFFPKKRKFLANFRRHLENFASKMP